MALSRARARGWGFESMHDTPRTHAHAHAHAHTHAHAHAHTHTCTRTHTRKQACNRQSAWVVPLYDTLGTDAIEYIIKHAEVCMCVCVCACACVGGRWARQRPVGGRAGARAHTHCAFAPTRFPAAPCSTAQSRH